MELKKFVVCLLTCFLILENVLAGTTASAKNNTETRKKVGIVRNKSHSLMNSTSMTQRELTQRRLHFVGRTMGIIDSILQSFSSTVGNISVSATSGSTSGLNSIVSSFPTSLLTISNEVAKIPLFVGLPIAIILIALLIKGIAYGIAIIPSYTSPIYNELKEQYGGSFDDDSDSMQGYGNPSSSYGVPSSSYGAPSSSYGAPAPSYGAPAPSYGAPSSSYGAPSPSSSYGAAAPSSNYGAPSPSSSYGAPAPSSSYGAPAPSSSYGSPSSNSRMSHDETKTKVLYKPGPTAAQLNTASHTLSQAVKKYSQL